MANLELVMGPRPRNPLKLLDYIITAKLVQALDRGYDGMVVVRCHTCSLMHSCGIDCLRCGSRKSVPTLATTLDLFKVWWRERKLR